MRELDEVAWAEKVLLNFGFIKLAKIELDQTTPFKLGMTVDVKVRTQRGTDTKAP